MRNLLRCFKKRQKRVSPSPGKYVLYKREQPIEWTLEMAAIHRRYMQSNTGKTLIMFQHDYLINKIMAGADASYVEGFKSCLQKLDAFMGAPVEKKEPEDKSEMYPIPILDDEDDL